MKIADRVSVGLLLAVMLAGVVAAACERRPEGTQPPPVVILYSSVDEPLLRQLVGEFQKRYPIKVEVVGDTEATKTTGLVQRLISEKDKPRADVWWSNELLGTTLLAEQDLFEAVPAPADLPAEFQDPANRFHAFGLRARAIAYSTKRVPETEAPRRLAELTAPTWKGRVGMARPQFGTTRAHMAMLLATSGEQALRTWLAAMKANGVRIYDGNSAVVRAIAQGEIDVGLTDTDDVFSGQRESWQVGLVYEVFDPARGEGESDPSLLISTGPLLIPNTVAMVKGCPHPEAAEAFIQFVLSEDVERMLAESDSRNTPLRAGVCAAMGPQFDRYAIPTTPPAGAPGLNPPALTADLAARAMKICEEELGL